MKNHSLMNQTAERMIADIGAGRSTIAAVCNEWNELCDVNGWGWLKLWRQTRRIKLFWELRHRQEEIARNDIEAARDGELALDAAKRDLRGAGAPVIRATTTQYVTFSHAGVTGRAEVRGKEVVVTYAGASSQLSAARGGLFRTVVAELSKAGILPKTIKSRGAA